MFVESLKIKNFRCFTHKEVSFKPGVNLFVGYNGLGKTSLIEGVFLLLSGSSFRTHNMDPLFQKIGENHSSSFVVEGKVWKNNLDYSIRCVAQGRKKSFTVNGKTMASHTLPSLFPKILFTPESLNSIKGAPENRRSLMDTALVQLYPDESTTCLDFKRALKQKNELLKMIKDGKIDMIQGRKTLKSLNTLFFERAFNLTLTRRRLLHNLMTPLKKSFSEIYPQISEADISMEYLMSGTDHLFSSDSQILNALSQKLSEMLEVELAMGKCLVGPHKHDMNFLFNSRDARSYCSQGQQRALVLAFQLAQIQRFNEVYSQPPLLLLDDVLSELDLEKRWFLLKLLSGLSAQIVITTTDLTTINQFDPSFGHVMDLGSVTEFEGGNDSREGVRV